MDHERLEIARLSDWRAWLKRRHTQDESVWVVTFKKGHPQYVPYDGLLDEALRWGWIDSLPRSLDEKRSMRRFSKRKGRSAWSQVNKRRIAALLAKGLMEAPGLAAIERAKAAGRWTSLDTIERLEEPHDLSAALDASAKARVEWDSFPRSVKRAILEWIHNAKREETRAARVAETVAKAARGERANQWRQPKSASRA